jgi:hypothetical protein
MLSVNGPPTGSRRAEMAPYQSLKECLTRDSTARSDTSQLTHIRHRPATARLWLAIARHQRPIGQYSAMTARAQRWHVPMSGRDPHEAHRAATPLELLFDLCFVVAVAQAPIALHHELADGHLIEGIVSYLMVFFAIWWAWINFTWFASAYDTDDVLYRLLTFVQMAGVLVIAAGVARAFEGLDYVTITVGYLIMPIGLVSGCGRAGAPRARAEV